MKKLITICLVVLVIAAVVHANVLSTSTASLHWESLSITGDIRWDGYDNSSYAYASDDTGNDEDYQWEEGGWLNTSAKANTNYAFGNAYTDDYYTYEKMSASAGKDTTILADANAEARRDGLFIANSDGWVEFSVPYSLRQELSTDEVGESASGDAEAEIYIYRWYIAPHFITQKAELSNSLSEPGYINLGDDGILSVSEWFYAGDAANFCTLVWNTGNAQIPEPATLSLLGLGALSLISRKNKKRSK